MPERASWVLLSGGHHANRRVQRLSQTVIIRAAANAAGGPLQIGPVTFPERITTLNTVQDERLQNLRGCRGAANLCVFASSPGVVEFRTARLAVPRGRITIRKELTFWKSTPAANPAPQSFEPRAPMPRSIRNSHRKFQIEGKVFARRHCPFKQRDKPLNDWLGVRSEIDW